MEIVITFFKIIVLNRLNMSVSLNYYLNLKELNPSKIKENGSSESSGIEPLNHLLFWLPFIFHKDVSFCDLVSFLITFNVVK